MNPNICNTCGGDYGYSDGRWRCRFCGAYKPEELSNEEVTLLYTAYQKLRLADFTEAEKEFDDILQKYSRNSNAYWGRLMAKFGIKYEQDFDGKMIPTCYATSIESLISSSDYQKALQYADDANKAHYKEQAEYMERVRREWLEKAKKEKPYDIFICYKDSDTENGIERTKDSIAAQDLYIHLTNKGYRVFYSHESLSNITGEKYEPYIFNALATSKVMIVYGSKPEYITSTWLKNEWTRYEKRVQNGEKKSNSLIVAYEGFSPSALPTALSSRQCLNASEKSFYTKLDDQIEKILHKEKPQETGSGKAPLVVTILLLLALFGGFIAWNFLGSGETVTSISDPRYGATISTKYGSFDDSTALRVETLSTEGEWSPTIDELHVDLHNSRLYNISLMKGKNTLAWEGDLTVSIPLPVDLVSERAVIYDLSGSAPKKVKYTTSNGKLEFSTNKLGVYLIAMREHTIEIDVAVEPTCTISGLTEGSHCSDCKEVLVAQQTIPALGHKAGAEATCTTSQICTVCNTELQPALGHDYQMDITKPTCTEQGYTEFYCDCGHFYVGNYINPYGHKPETVSCTEDQHCTVCNEKLASAKGHEYQETVTNPTCTEQGYTKYTCHCGHSYTDSQIAALGHHAGTDATCTTDQICTVCNHVLKKAFGHTPGKVSCTVDQHCTVCNEKLASAKEHNYKITVVAPTCTERGYTTYTCDCGDTYKDKYVDATGHMPGANASCTKPSSCSVCGEIIPTVNGHLPGPEATCTTAQICTICHLQLAPALGHTPSAEATCTEAQICTVCKIILSSAMGHSYQAVVTPPTCVEQGYTTYTCECGDVYTSNYTSAMGHDYDSVITPPTCTKQGYTTYTCQCGDAYIGDHKNATGHTYVAVITAPTCTERGYTTHTCSCGDTYTDSYKSSLGGHAPGAAATCTAAQTCTVCKIELKPMLPHTPGKEATCTEAQYCTVCNTTLVSAKGHILNDQAKCTVCNLVFSSQGLTYSQNSDGTYTVTGIGTCEDILLVIPSTYNGGIVSKIGKNAFDGCKNVKTIIIPNTIEEIAQYAFKDCSGLTEIKVPDSVQKIGLGAFSGCSGLVEMTLPFVGGSATPNEDRRGVLGYIFEDNEPTDSLMNYSSNIYVTSSAKGYTSQSYYDSYTKKMYYFVIPQSLRKITITNQTVIPSYAFQNCDLLEEIILPSGVEEIGSYAFDGCKALTEIEIPYGVAKIKQCAFKNCSGLTAIVVPNSVTTIEDSAFSGCTGLVEITLPFVGFKNNTDTRWGTFGYIFGDDNPDDSVMNNSSAQYATSGEEGYTSQTYYSGNMRYFAIPKSIRKVTITAQSYVSAYAFQNCDMIEEIVFVKSVTSIGTNAFDNCNATLNIP